MWPTRSSARAPLDTASGNSHRDGAMNKPAHFLKTWAAIVGFQALGFITVAATALLMTVAVPPSIYGEYWLLLSTLQICGGIALSWVAQTILPIARDEMRATGAVHGSLVSALLLQGLLMVLMLAAGLFVREHVRSLGAVSMTVVLLIVVATAASAAFETMSYAAQASGRFEGLGAGSLLTKLGPLAAVMIIALGVPARSEVLIGGFATGFLAALVFMFRNVPSPAKATWPLRATIRQIGRLGALRPLAAAAGVLSIWIPSWFVAAHGGMAETGTFAWAASIHLLVGALLMPLSAVLSPQLIDLVLDDRRQAIAGRISIFVSLMVLAACLAPLALTAVHLATALLPASYARSGPILVLLLSTVPAQLLSYLLSPLLQARAESVRMIVLVNVITASANVALNFALTPIFWGLGAAAALAVATWCGSFAVYCVAAGLARSDGSAAWRDGVGIMMAIAAAVCVTTALLLPGARPVVAVPIAFSLTVLCVLASRKAGLLAPLKALDQLTSVLPQGARRSLTRFAGWCDTVTPDRERDGAA